MDIFISVSFVEHPVFHCKQTGHTGRSDYNRVNSTAHGAFHSETEIVWHLASHPIPHQLRKKDINKILKVCVSNFTKHILCEIE